MVSKETVIALLHTGKENGWNFEDYRANCPFKSSDRIDHNMMKVALMWKVREMNPADKGRKGKMIEIMEDAKGKEWKLWGTFHAKRQNVGDLTATIEGHHHSYELKTGAGDWYPLHEDHEDIESAVREYIRNKGNGYIRWFVSGQFELKMNVADFIENLTEYNSKGIGAWFSIAQNGKLYMKPITKNRQYIKSKIEFLQSLEDRNIYDWIEEYED